MNSYGNTPVRPGDITIGIIILLFFSLVIFGISLVFEGLEAAYGGVIGVAITGGILSLFVLPGVMMFYVVRRFFERRARQADGSVPGKVDKLTPEMEKALRWRKVDGVVGTIFLLLLITITFVPGLLRTPETVLPRIGFIAGVGGLIGVAVAVIRMVRR